MRKFVYRFGLVLFAGVLLAPSLAAAQDDSANRTGAFQETSDQQGEDPPARVGRLGFFEGDVSQFGHDQDDWSPAQLNFPITSNSAFATGANGRAEFELGGAVARIGNGTELDVVALDEQDTDLRLPQGTASVHLPKLADDGTPAATVVTTPRGDVALSAPGRYVIDAGTEDRPTIVTVYDGQAQLTDAAGAAFNIAAGQAGLLTGDGNQPTFATRAAQIDPLETWAQQRERQYVASAPLPPQVSPAMTGVSVLAAYGSWQTEPQYGPVWIPRGVAAGWEPYREGHWAYVRPWGWTWIDNEPWGFAPFHYGRWVRVRNGWAWAPGAVAQRPGVEMVARPVYAPALVVFASVGASAAGPGVAWYPLGWNEPYIPAHRVSRDYIERVNVRVVERPRIVQVNNIYNRIYVRGGNFDPYAELHVDAHRDRAVAVPRAAFTGARPVAQAVFKPQVQALRPMVRPAAVQAPPAKPARALRTAEPPKPKILPAAKRAPIPQKLMAPKPAGAPGNRPVPAAATGSTPSPGPAKPGVAPAVKPAVTSPPHAPAKPGVAPAVQPTVTSPPRAPAKPGVAPAVTSPPPKPVNPAAKPAVVPPPKLPEHRPAAVKPEAKPAATSPALRPETKATTKPEAKPQVQSPAKPAPHPAMTHPEHRPVAQPPAKSATQPVERPKPAVQPPAKPAPQPAARHAPKPEARPAASSGTLAPRRHEGNSSQHEHKSAPRPGEKSQP